MLNAEFGFKFSLAPDVKLSGVGIIRVGVCGFQHLQSAGVVDSPSLLCRLHRQTICITFFVRTLLVCKRLIHKK